MRLYLSNKEAEIVKEAINVYAEMDYATGHPDGKLQHIVNVLLDRIYLCNRLQHSENKSKRP